MTDNKFQLVGIKSKFFLQWIYGELKNIFKPKNDNVIYMNWGEYHPEQCGSKNPFIMYISKVLSYLLKCGITS